MKPSDLRIGNLVSIHYPHGGWKTTIIQSVNTEFIMTANHEYFFFKDGLIKGEVLTKGWYENLGFNLLSEEKTLFDHKTEWVHPTIGQNFKFIHFKDINSEPQNRLVSFSLPYDLSYVYVHQLQNLFYVLTGTELDWIIVIKK